MIYINDKSYPFEQEQSLVDLFSNLKMEVTKGIAVAVNNKVIPRSEWMNCKIHSEDKLLLIKATQGG